MAAVHAASGVDVSDGKDKPSEAGVWSFQFKAEMFDDINEGDLEPSEFAEVKLIRQELEALHTELGKRKESVTEKLEKAKAFREKARIAVKKRKADADAAGSGTTATTRTADGSASSTTNGAGSAPAAASPNTQELADKLSKEKMAKAKADAETAQTASTVVGPPSG